MHFFLHAKLENSSFVKLLAKFQNPKLASVLIGRDLRVLEYHWENISAGDLDDQPLSYVLGHPHLFASVMSSLFPSGSPPTMSHLFSQKTNVLP